MKWYHSAGSALLKFDPMTTRIIHFSFSQMTTRLLLIPLLWLTVLGASAAERDSAKGVSVRLFAVALSPDQGPTCLMVGESRGEAFEIPTLTLSAPQRVARRDILLISANTPTDAQPVPLATIRLPDQGSDFRIILVPVRGGSYKSVVIRGDDTSFNHGDFFFINLSNHEMLGLLGTTRLNLKPGSQEIIRPERAKTDKSFEVKFARRDQDRLMPLTNTRWPVVLDNRSYVIFYNGSSGRPTYRAVDEFMAVSTVANP